MRYKIWAVKLDETDHVGDVSIGGGRGVTIKIDFKDTDMCILIWFICRTSGSSNENCINKVMKLQVLQKAEMSKSAEKLSVF
jgi:hypothetical protein